MELYEKIILFPFPINNSVPIIIAHQKSSYKIINLPTSPCDYYIVILIRI